MTDARMHRRRVVMLEMGRDRFRFECRKPYEMVWMILLKLCRDCRAMEKP